MRMSVLVISGCTAIASAILGATPAIADDLPITPVFGMMDNTGDGTELVLDVATILPTRDVDFALLHPRIFMQHVAASGLGAYAGMGASLVVGDGGTNEAGLGNLDIGGLYQRVLSDQFAIGVRAGAILDTGTGDTRVNTTATALARPGDLATAAPGNWIRLAVSPTYHQGIGFARLDAGVDIAVDSDLHIDRIEHANIGAGFGADRWSFTAELGGVRVSNESDSETLVVAGLAARYHNDQVSPCVMVSGPLNNGLAGDVITLTVGINFSPAGRGS